MPRFIDEVTRGLQFVYAYIDDILITSNNATEHEQHLRQLFERLRHCHKPSQMHFRCFHSRVSWPQSHPTRHPTTRIQSQSRS